MSPPLLRAAAALGLWLARVLRPRSGAAPARSRASAGQIIEARRPSGSSIWVTSVDNGG